MIHTRPAPLKNSWNSHTAESASVAPKSGWSAIRTTVSSKRAKLTRSPRKLARSRRSARREALATTNVGLTNSDGWVGKGGEKKGGGVGAAPAGGEAAHAGEREQRATEHRGQRQRQEEQLLAQE